MPNDLDALLETPPVQEAPTEEKKVKGPYESQKKYYKELKTKGLVRHSLITEKTSRDAFVKACDKLGCSQGELFVAMVKALQQPNVLAVVQPLIVRSGPTPEEKAKKETVKKVLEQVKPEDLQKLLAMAKQLGIQIG